MVSRSRLRRRCSVRSSPWGDEQPSAGVKSLRFHVSKSAPSFRTGLDKSVETGMRLLTSYALIGIGRTLAAADRGPEAAMLLAHNVRLEPNPYASLAQEPLDELREKLSTAELQHAESQAAGLSVEDAVAMARSAVTNLIEHSG